MSDAPKRIQRSRAKGWRMPPNTVYVGRPSLFGNPFIGDAAACVDAYRMWLTGRCRIDVGQDSPITRLAFIPAHVMPRRINERLVPDQ